MTRTEFFDNYIKDVRIRISNREECYAFQKIAFEFGVRVHSQMNEPEQYPISYNIADVIPSEAGKSYAKDMNNLVIYDNGTRLQQSGFFGLETDKKLIEYADFLHAYVSIED